MDNSYLANLSFALNRDVNSKDAIASRLYRLVFQVKGSMPYDREQGGSFENMENENDYQKAIYEFMRNVVESVYRDNSRNSSQPFIVVGFNDISVIESEDKTEKFIEIHYRNLNDLKNDGTIKI